MRNPVWQLYLDVMSAIHTGIQKLMIKLGRAVGRSPLLGFIIGLVVLGLCCIGFLGLKFESDMDKVYTPQDSKPMEYKDWYTEPDNFNKFARLNAFYYMAEDKKSSVFTAEHLSAMVDLHVGITALTAEVDGKTYTYQDLCYRPAAERKTFLWAVGMGSVKGDCMAGNIAQFYAYNKGTIQLLASMNMLSTVFAGIHISIPGNLMTGMKLDPTTNLPIDGIGYSSGYYLRTDDDHKEACQKWEEKFVDFIQKWEDDHENCITAVLAEDSMDEEIAKTVTSDVNLYAIGICLMVVYVAFAIGKFSWVESKPALSLAALFTIVLAVGAGFGLAAAAGVNFATITIFLVLLLLCVGMDNVFIITNALGRTDSKLSMEERLGKTMEDIGVNVTLSMLCSVFAYLISITSELPAIVSFCAYAVFSLITIYIAFLTIFLAFLVWDEKRLLAGRMSLLCCVKSKIPPPHAANAESMFALC